MKSLLTLQTIVFLTIAAFFACTSARVRLLSNLHEPEPVKPSAKSAVLKLTQ